ncbi:hypothetical protein Pcinc_008975, partial [Petrolisthes cinctipes]
KTTPRALCITPEKIPKITVPLPLFVAQIIEAITVPYIRAAQYISLSATDHFPILLTATSFKPAPSLPRWRYNRADWSSFTALATPSTPLHSLDNQDDALNCCCTTLQIASEDSIPHTACPAGVKRVPWWNKECAKEFHVK